MQHPLDRTYWLERGRGLVRLVLRTILSVILFILSTIIHLYFVVSCNVGKTLAFLVPGIQSALRSGRMPGRHGYSVVNDDGTVQQRGGIAMLILSPTRELAAQIHNQAQALTSSHSNSGGGDDDDSTTNKKYPMVSQVMYGGSSRNNDQKSCNRIPPSFLLPLLED